MKDIKDFMMTDDSKLTLESSSILFIKEKFIDFDSELLVIDIFKNFGFSLNVMYSIDNQNWSIPKSISEFDIEIKYYKKLAQINNVEFYCYIKIIVKLIDSSNNIFTQYNQNLSDYFPTIIFNDISYNDETLLNKYSNWTSMYLF